jgi:hypothetical protein
MDFVTAVPDGLATGQYSKILTRLFPLIRSDYGQTTKAYCLANIVFYDIIKNSPKKQTI